MSSTAEEVWELSLNSCDLQKERHRELVFDNLSTNGPKKVSLMFKDTELGGTYKIPLGKVTPKAHATGSLKENVIVPVIPMIYTTPDHDKYEATSARKGWIYIFKNGYLWREIEVVDRSYMRDINLTVYQGKDRRPSTCERDTRIALPYKIGGIDQKIEMAFSETQWSWDYINSLGGMAKDDPRLEPATKTTSTNLGKYAKGTRDIRLTKISNLGEYPNLFDAGVNKKEINSVKDVSSTLHRKVHMKSSIGAVYIPDPIGISKKLALKHEGYWGDLNRFIESLRTGEDPNSVKVVTKPKKPIVTASINPLTTAFNILKKLTDPNSQEYREFMKREIAAQFDSLGAIYRVAFGSKDGIKKMGSNMNKSIFITYLGKNERQTIRNNISEARKELVKYIESDEYQTSLSEFINNTPERILEGKGWVCLTLRMLDMPIHSADAHLDLPDEVKNDQNDVGIKYVSKTFDGGNHAGQLLLAIADAKNDPEVKKLKVINDEKLNSLMSDPGIPITSKLLAVLENKGMDILSKVSGVATSLVDTLAKKTLTNTKNLEGLVVRLNTIRVHGFPEYTVLGLPYEGPTIPKGYKKTGPSTLKIEKSVLTGSIYFPTSKQVVMYSGDSAVIFNGRSTTVYPVTLETTDFKVSQIVEKTVPDTSTSSSIARNILNSKLWSRGFGSFLIVLEFVNVKSAFAESRKAISTSKKWRSNINWLGTISGTGSTLAYLTEVWATQYNKTSLAVKSAKISSSLARVSLVPAAILSGWDAVDNYNEKDYDAASAYALSAVFTVGAFFAMSGVGTIVLGVIALGFFIFGLFLEDDPLEVFSKNGPMNSDIKVKQGGTVWDKLKKSARSTSVAKKFDKWQTWQDVKYVLYDYLFTFNLRMRLDYNMKAGFGSMEKYAKSAEVIIKPRDFYAAFSELEIYCRLYEGSKISTKYQEMRIKNISVETDKKTGRVKKFIYNFDLPKGVKVENWGLIMCCARIKRHMHGNNYIPRDTYQGKPRYIAEVKQAADLAIATYGGGAAQIVPDPVYGTGKVGTLDEIENHTFWDNS